MWTFPVMDFRTGTLITDNMPIRVDSFTDQLGVAVGGLSGSCPVSGGPIPADEALLLWRRVIVPCWLGRPRGAYVVTQHGQYNNRSAEVSFTAERVDAVLKRRRLWSTLQFVKQDQLDIVRALIGYGIGLTVLPGLDAPFMAMLSPLPLAARLPWWTLDPTTSPVRRSRLDNDAGYQMQQNLEIADLVTKLSQLEPTDPSDPADVGGAARLATGLPGSFDYRLDYTRNPSTGALGVTVRLGYPRLGSADPLPLEYPSPGVIQSWAMGADASDTETMTRMFGPGSGVERVMGPIATDHGAHGTGWPLLMGAESSTASEPGTLAEQAHARQTDHRGPLEGWAVSVPEALLDSYELGDTALLRIRNARWPELRQVPVRVTGHKVAPSQPGVSGGVDLMVTPL